MPAGSDTVAPSRPSDRITRTGSSSAAGSRPRRRFFLAPRAGVRIFDDLVFQGLHFAHLLARLYGRLPLASKGRFEPAMYQGSSCSRFLVSCVTRRCAQKAVWSGASKRGWSRPVRLCPAQLFVHAGQCRAALPEQQSSSVVPGPRRRRNRCGSVKVLPRHPGNVWRGGEIDHRFCAVSR